MTSKQVLVIVGAGPADPAAPLLRADDLGVLRGESVFETLLVSAGEPMLLDKHLRRLHSSAERLVLALPADGEWRETVTTALQHWGARDGVLRLVCSKGTDKGDGQVGFALITPVPELTLQQRYAGVRAVTLSLGVAAGAREQAPWLLGGVKCTSYAVNMAALRTAAQAGLDDVVWVSSDSEVLEGPTSSVAWVEASGALVTPPPEVGILPGITVAAVLRAARARGLATHVRRGTLDELRHADEAALVSSIRGVAPLLELDGQPVGRAATGGLLQQLGTDCGYAVAQQPEAT